MMKSLQLAEARPCGSHWFMHKMFLPLVFLSQHLINAQAETMHGAKGCERRYIACWIVFSIIGQYVPFLVNSHEHCICSWCSTVLTRANSPTTLQTQAGISRMVRLRLKKGVVAPSCEESFMRSWDNEFSWTGYLSLWVWCYRVVQSGVWDRVATRTFILHDTPSLRKCCMHL